MVARLDLGQDHGRQNGQTDARRDETQHAVHLAAVERDRRLEAGAPTGCERLVAQVIGTFAQHHERLRAQLIESDAALSAGQRMLSRHGQKQLLLEQRQCFQRWMPDRLNDDGKVELALFEEF